MVVTMTSVTWMYPSPGLSLAYTNSMRSHTSQWASCPYGSGTNSSLPFRLLTDIWWEMTVETMNIWYEYTCLVIGQTLNKYPSACSPTSAGRRTVETMYILYKYTLLAIGQTLNTLLLAYQHLQMESNSLHCEISNWK